MKTKTNKEIIEEFREKFVGIIQMPKKEIKKGQFWVLDEVEEFILKVLDQKEREVREKLGLNKKCLIYVDNHNFILRQCVDCGLIITKEQKKIEKELTLLERLEKHMHNWWWLGVDYDWDMNPEKGKVWVFKDCTGIYMKAIELSIIELWVAEHYKK